MSYQITPTVDGAHEFLEIANDFSDPFDLVREAVSNSYDAGASCISIIFDAPKEKNKFILLITLSDDGSGMDKEGLQAFFDLGHSTKRTDALAIGEKGHGTKTYFNSKSVFVQTTRDGNTFEATLSDPFEQLYSGILPIVQVEERPAADGERGTTIIIKEYNDNEMAPFTHDRLKDHVIWFTKHGSVEGQFKIDKYVSVQIQLKGLDREEAETMPFGHIFATENTDLSKLFDTYGVNSPDYYCSKIIRQGHLKNFPSIRYQAIFAVEGNRAKYQYNRMLRRSGYTAPDGAYRVQERYGLWLCKDYIPIQKKNEWITRKGYEFTKFHAFFNCQELRLTANRGSVDNTPADIMSDIRDEIDRIFVDIIEGDDWRNIEWLEEESQAYYTGEKEERDYQARIDRANRARICSYKGFTLVEPYRESGVLALFLILSFLEPDLFPFEIVDYDTYSGIDVIARSRQKLSLLQTRLFYVEFKHLLQDNLNHGMKNLHSIVCWDCALQHDQEITDVLGEARRAQIIAPQEPGGETQWFLDNPKKPVKIQIYVLKQFLKEKLGLEFAPRTNEQLV